MSQPPPETRIDSTGPAARIADALVVVLSPGTGLEQWHQMGVLEREWALYERLGASFGRVVVVSDTPPPSDEVMAIVRQGVPDVRLVANPGGAERPRWLNAMGSALASSLEGCGSAVIKSNQFSASEAALAVLASCERLGIEAGLVARGGYLWSRFEAELNGPGSKVAAEVASREGELLRASHAVVGTSQTMIDDMAWRYGLEPEHVRVIPNYIIDSGPVLDASQRDPSTVLVCSQLVTRKRVEITVEALAQIPEAGRPLLEVVGEGPERRSLEAMAEDCGVRSDFVGRLSHGELLERMRRCTLFVQMSAREGHPKTVLEAMAAGAPVIVAEAPGLTEQLSHGVTGMVCPPSASALAHMIEGMAQDAAWRNSIGESAALHIRRISSLGVVADAELDTAAAALCVARQGDRAGGAPSPVRWSAALLAEPAERAVDAWRHSLHGYAKRLEPTEAARFLAHLDAWTYSMQGEAAVRADPEGLHPKHRLTDYHGFFADQLAGRPRVLDLGSGVGALACTIAERTGAQVVGQELDPQRAERASRLADERGVAGCSFTAGDITSQRVEGAFDAVVLSNVLEHLAERPRLLRQWTSWYRPERFVIRVPSYDREWRVPWKDELGVDSRLDHTHEIEFTREQLESELTEAGLEVTHLEHRWGEYWVVARPVASDAADAEAA